MTVDDHGWAWEHDDESDKASIVRGELSRLCSLFPGNVCETLIKAARNKDVSADQGVQLRSALQRKMVSKKPFVFAAFGSSVTAGHDNFPNQSWPFELERILNPTFEKLGFGFEMRQRALGSAGGGTYNAGCLETRCGSGVDAINWEWHMFGDPKCAVHKFVRGAYSLNENRHAPVIFDLEQTHSEMKGFRKQIHTVSDATKVRQQIFNNSDLDKALDFRKWHPNTWYLTDAHISPAEVDKWHQFNIGNVKLVETMPTKESTMEEVESEQWQSANEKPSKEQQADIDLQAKATLDGKYPEAYLNKTGAMNGFIEAGFGYEAFYASGGLSGVPLTHRPWYGAREKAFMINWHPGPLGHLLIATQLAHYILEELLHTLQENEAQAAIPKMPVLSGGCGGMPRSCSTGVRPHTGPDIASAIVKGHSWDQKLSSHQLHGKEELSWQNYDKKMPLVGSASDPALVLQVTGTKPGDVVMVCAAPCSFGCQRNQGFVTADQQSHADWISEAKYVASQVTKPVADVEYRLDGQLVSDAKLNEMTSAVLGRNGSFCPMCSDFRIVCQPVAELSKGTHELSLKVRPSSPIFECNHEVNKKCVNNVHSPIYVSPKAQGGQDTFVEILQLMVVPGPNSA
jgi:hypothetical protein